MRRREFIVSLGCSLLAKSITVTADELSRIGFLRVGRPPPSYIGGFWEGLREQGLIEGQNVTIEYALTQTAAQIPEAAVELVRRRVDIIVAAGTPSVFPARNAAGKIPVVFVATFDAVATGLSDYGLASSVWTKDVGCAVKTAARLQYGCTWINTHFMLTTSKSLQIGSLAASDDPPDSRRASSGLHQAARPGPASVPDRERSRARAARGAIATMLRVPDWAIDSVRQGRRAASCGRGATILGNCGSHLTV